MNRAIDAERQERNPQPAEAEAGTIKSPLFGGSCQQCSRTMAAVLRRCGIDRDFVSRPPGSGRVGPEASGYLQSSNPRLLELREAYRRRQSGILTHSRWSQEFVRRDVPLLSFRGDCAYVWQRRDLNAPIHLVLTAYYLMASEAAPYLELGEDDLFGAYVVRVAHTFNVSRDLLDSINEMWFLDSELGLRKEKPWTILDIGSGYGRLAYRLVCAFPKTVKVLCVDAIAESTFLSEYYMRCRRVESRARVVAFTEVEEVLTHQRVDVAVNIHSFSECTLKSIRWWLDLVVAHRVKYLMIVPNAGRNGGAELLSLEEDGSHLDFAVEIASTGYRLVVCRPKYSDPVVQRYGVSPTHYFLFELG